MRTIERAFEALLWNSRFLIVIAVVASLVGALVMFAVASADVLRLIGDLRRYLDPGADAHALATLRDTLVTGVASTIDGFLFATILIIFALGLYELFISKIEPAETSEFAERLLLIRSLDDLKDRLAKVIFLILVVRYFEYALQQHAQSPLDALYLAVGIVLVAGGLYLTRTKH